MDGRDLTKSTYERFTGCKYNPPKKESVWVNYYLQATTNTTSSTPSAHFGWWPAPPENVLQEADRIINTARPDDYGTPEDNFKTIGDLWQTILSFRNGTNVVVSSQDVATMMVLLKVARNLHKTTRDNLVDIAGYAGCAAKIEKID